MKISAKQIVEVGRVAGALMGHRCTLQELRRRGGFRTASDADWHANFLLGYVVLSLKKKVRNLLQSANGRGGCLVISTRTGPRAEKQKRQTK